LQKKTQKCQQKTISCILLINLKIQIIPIKPTICQQHPTKNSTPIKRVCIPFLFSSAFFSHFSKFQPFQTTETNPFHVQFKRPADRPTTPNVHQSKQWPLSVEPCWLRTLDIPLVD
jgi:hypothetical protein